MHKSHQQRFEFSSRGNRTLYEFHRGRDCVTVTFSPGVSAISYKLSQHQQLKNPTTFKGGSEFKTVKVN